MCRPFFILPLYLKLTTMTTTTNWPALPKNVPANCYRFFCNFLRKNLFDNTLVLDVDGNECVLTPYQATVGLVEGKLCVDIKEPAVKTWGLA